MDEQLIIEIWEVFKEYILEKNRDVAASQFIDFLENQDVDLDTFEGLLGYDPHLDSAIELVLSAYKEIIDDEDDEDDLDFEEDEDY
jgi:hypothetical protein